MVVSLGETWVDPVATSVVLVKTSFESPSVIVTLVVVGLLALLLHGVLKTATSGIGPLKDHATFCRWLAMQISPDQVGDGAQMAAVVASAADVVSPSFANDWAPTVDRIRSGAVSKDALSVPEETPDQVAACIQHLVSGSTKPDDVALDIAQ